MDKASGLTATMPNLSGVSVEFQRIRSVSSTETCVSVNCVTSTLLNHQPSPSYVLFFA